MENKVIFILFFIGNCFEISQQPSIFEIATNLIDKIDEFRISIPELFHFKNKKRKGSKKVSYYVRVLKLIEPKNKSPSMRRFLLEKNKNLNTIRMYLPGWWNGIHEGLKIPC